VRDGQPAGCGERTEVDRRSCLHATRGDDGSLDPGEELGLLRAELDVDPPVSDHQQVGLHVCCDEI